MHDFGFPMPSNTMILPDVSFLDQHEPEGENHFENTIKQKQL